jgi:hypothetical protein
MVVKITIHGVGRVTDGSTSAGDGARRRLEAQSLAARVQFFYLKKWTGDESPNKAVVSKIFP